jgi:hypothetical protein
VQSSTTTTGLVPVGVVTTAFRTPMTPGGDTAVVVVADTTVKVSGMD